jgi:ferredoxin-thioredoxin reductase catalytic subunit/rubredoxin
MSDEITISSKDIDVVYNRLNQEAESGGYHLNPDVEFTKDLINGLLVNEKRYGYWACPCRLATGDKLEDLDIICPCDYRDADIGEFDACYCALYISTAALKGGRSIHSIPERRPLNRADRAQIKEKTQKTQVNIDSLSKPVWRCKVCGYLCARDEPPDICPICKVKKDRFERFM